LSKILLCLHLKVDLLDKIKTDLQNSMRHLELEKLEDHKLIQRSEAQIVVLEKGSLEDRREIIEFHEKCKSLEEHNNNLEDQVNLSFEDFSYIETITLS
jgi:hypothetical protein